jgi:hypothetical protein
MRSTTPLPTDERRLRPRGHSRAWETGLPAFMPMQDSALENGDLGGLGSSGGRMGRPPRLNGLGPVPSSGQEVGSR